MTHDTEAQIDRLLQRFDKETQGRRFSMTIGGFPADEVSDYVSIREDQRAGLAARIRREIERDEHAQRR